MRHLLLLALLLPAQDSETLRVAWTPPSTLDPAKASSLADARILAALFEGLTTFAADGVTPEPGAAERWSVSEDGLTWTFHLRDAKWSDGEPVTAHDFVFAWKRLLDARTRAAYPDAIRLFKNVAAFSDSARAIFLADDLLASATVKDRGADFAFLEKAARKNCAPRLEQMIRRGVGEREVVERILAAAKARDEIAIAELGFGAVDDRTLRIALERPAPWLLQSLGFMALYPVPEKSVRALGDRWSDPRVVVTNGPYRIASSDNVAMTLARVRGGGPPKVVLDWLQPDEAMRRFEQKKVDWLDGETIPGKVLLKVAQQKEFHYSDLWGAWFLRFNAERDPFRKPGMRRAIAHATDRNALVEVVRSNPTVSLVPPGFPGYRSAEAPKLSNSAAMVELLKAYVDITAIPVIEFLVPDSQRPAAEKLKETWEASLGIQVRILGMKGPAYAQALAAGKYDVALSAWVGEYFDPLAFLEPWPAVEKFLVAAEFERDPAKRLALLAPAEKFLIAEECAIVPLWLMGGYELVSDRVRGLSPNPMGRVLLSRVSLGR